MTRRSTTTLAHVGLSAILACATSARAQHMDPHRTVLPSNFILPQRSALVVRGATAATLTKVEARVSILEQVATTTLDVSLANPGSLRLEAELIVPVPEGAVVRGFAYEGAAREATALVLPKDEARRTYDSIVAKSRDPALLEFIGYNLVKSSVFPIEARGSQKVRLTYEHVLPADGARIDYILPRTESLDYRVPWEISVRIRAKAPIATVFCPSHEIETRRVSDDELAVRLAAAARETPGSFRLSYLRQQNGVSASLMAYPDPTIGGGCFLLLMGLPPRPAPDAARAGIKREVTLVLDRSGSMSGEKLRQVRASAIQILAGLAPGERFNLLVYNEAVDAFAPAPVARDDATLESARRFLEGVRAQGGTNIHDALLEALRQRPSKGTLPIVLFLTDGLPTVGTTSEATIRRLASEANPHGRRVFTLGVGTDVNVPLLDKVASASGGVPTYVLPGEDVEVKVAQLFKRLDGPVLADLSIETVDEHDHPEPSRTSDRIPARLPDLFEGEQLTLLGQYRGEEALRFRLSGNHLGARRTFAFTCDLEGATTRNAFVPRLWASRKIGVLLDAVRELGADEAPWTAAAAHAPDARTRELTDEILRLSVKHGILTEYTAFLAREGTDLGSHEQIVAEAVTNLRQRAQETRVGLSAANQSANVLFMSNQAVLNSGNAFLTADMSRVSVATVQQVNDLAFYQRAGRWVDSRLVGRSERPDRVVTIGSKEFAALAERLAGEHRQGSVALRGEVLLEVDGQTILVR